MEVTHLKEIKDAIIQYIQEMGKINKQYQKNEEKNISQCYELQKKVKEEEEYKQKMIEENDILIQESKQIQQEYDQLHFEKQKIETKSEQ